MDKKVKALSRKLVVVNGSIEAIESMLAKVPNNSTMLELAHRYLDLVYDEKVKIMNEYTKALEQLWLFYLEFRLWLFYMLVVASS